MSSIWTVSPETDRVELMWQGHAFWIELKRDLTEGERRRVETAGFSSVRSGGASTRPGAAASDAEIIVDWTKQSMARTLTYLVDWSLSDDKGNKLPLDPLSRKRDVIEALRPEVYTLIDDAITAHVEAREHEKKVRNGDAGLKAISA